MVLAAMLHNPTAAGACVGDCDGSGSVDVTKIIKMVNIALGVAPVTDCDGGDPDNSGTIDVTEIVQAVNNALGSCPAGSFAGSYAAPVTFDATHSGVVNLTAEATGQVSGSLVIGGSSAAANSRFVAALSFTFPVGGVSVAVSGTYDPVTGGFEVTGSFVDGSGHTVDVDISGNLPGPSGTAPVNVYIGTDVFPATLSAGMLATPTVGPNPTPTPGPSTGARLVYVGGLTEPHTFVINLDGSGKTQIHTSTGIDHNPAWSPDGTKIAFATPDANNDHIGIAIMNADGSGFHRLAEDTAFLDDNPAWSPNASQIVFTAGGGDAIDVMNADGSNRHRLVTKIGGEIYGHLTWSPNGDKIAFETTRPHGGGNETNFELWIMQADGSGLASLTENGFPDQHPAWKPDGSVIAFAAQRNIASAKNIYLINPSGTGETQITHELFGASAPTWSHDGQKIAYATLLSGITVANANGSSPAAVPGTQGKGITDFDIK